MVVYWRTGLAIGIRGYDRRAGLRVQAGGGRQGGQAGGGSQGVLPWG